MNNEIDCDCTYQVVKTDNDTLVMLLSAPEEVFVEPPSGWEDIDDDYVVHNYNRCKNIGVMFLARDADEFKRYLTPYALKLFKNIKQQYEAIGESCIMQIGMACGENYIKDKYVGVVINKKNY